jgi:heme/copper-type cytochrome/quinol oxidase subunit 2
MSSAGALLGPGIIWIILFPIFIAVIIFFPISSLINAFLLRYSLKNPNGKLARDSALIAVLPVFGMVITAVFVIGIWKLVMLGFLY